MIRTTLIDSHPNEYIQELHYYPFSAKLDRCAGSCNTINDLSNKACVQKKTRRFTSKCFQHDHRYKWIENIKKVYFMRM